MFKKKSLIALVSLLAILCVTVGGTLAYLIDTAEPVINTFTPAEVTTSVDEDTEDGVKSSVRIKNTGETDAYIRAAVVITWKDDAGNVCGQMPQTNANCSHGTDCSCDYVIAFNLSNGWSKGSDGFYYWKGIVKCDDEAPEDCYTGVLITSCVPQDTAPEGYSLAVEIIGSGIQARGMTGTTPAVQDAWGEDAAKAVGAIS